MRNSYLGWYIARRVAWAVVATFIILSITFFLMYLTPETHTQDMMFSAAVEQGQDPDEIRETIEAQRGQDRPVHEQYIDYMVNMATFNWGWSHTRMQPVTEAVANAYPYSLMYGIPAVILSTILGLAIGLYSATNQYTRTDYAATFFAFFGLSIPNFWFAIVLLLLFGVYLEWVPITFDANAAKDPNGNITVGSMLSGDNLRQLVLPVFVLTTGAIASMMRYARAEALEYVRADFVKTAKAKGASGRRILYRHIFRPASVPLSTIMVGDLLGIIFVASYLIEVVFSIPGLGQLSYNAIMDRDTPVVMATVLIPTFVAIIGNLVQDIAYTVLDPRIDFGDR
ncbi:ABC transporter permease [Natrononativus amylolyticus]|uniref:ABC transporter permease n=1 Tax=Natrononativus amylolyticus TaxID=2963434 RepID=UPI0020CE0AE1|nr:ABC transporter permease [Natrononativus amylolyticus]